jgi:hypothetical protein
MKRVIAGWGLTPGENATCVEGSRTIHNHLIREPADDSCVKSRIFGDHGGACHERREAGGGGVTPRVSHPSGWHCAGRHARCRAATRRNAKVNSCRGIPFQRLRLARAESDSVAYCLCALCIRRLRA